MQYISPFHFFTFPNLPDGSTALNISKIKKQVKAKFEFNDNEPLQINTTYVHLKEANALIDTLKESRIFQNHIYIYKHKALLEFLEKGKFSNDLIDVEPFTEEFKNWVSPYFAFQYDHCLYQQIKTAKSINALLSFPYASFIATEEYTSMYTQAHHHYQRILFQLKLFTQLSEKESQLKSKEVCGQLSEDFFYTLRMLPSYFHHIREEYIDTIPQVVESLRTHSAKYRETLLILERTNTLQYPIVWGEKDENKTEQKKYPHKNQPKHKNYNGQILIIGLLFMIGGLLFYFLTKKTTPNEGVKTEEQSTHENVNHKKIYTVLTDIAYRISWSSPLNTQKYSTTDTLQEIYFFNREKKQGKSPVVTITAPSKLDCVFFIFVELLDANKPIQKYSGYLKQGKSVQLNPGKYKKVYSLGYFGTAPTTDTCRYCYQEDGMYASVIEKKLHVTSGLLFKENEAFSKMKMHIGRQDININYREFVNVYPRK